MIKIQNMALQDVEMLVEWAAAEGWNPGLDDAATFYSADPDGFLMATYDGQPAACVAVVRQGPEHAFLGLYICKPEFRKLGCGWAVWQAGMEFLGDRVVGLDGVPEQQSNYAKSGFAFCYNSSRYQGAPTIPAVSERVATDLQCRPFNQSDTQALLKMDFQVHGFHRAQLLAEWFKDSDTRKTLVCARNGFVVGVGTIRACRADYKIGPLMVNDTEVARYLISSLVSCFDVSEIIIDVPEPNAPAVELVTEMSLKPVFTTARMFKGAAPAYNLSALYGVTSFELG